MRLIDADSLKALFDTSTWQGDMLIKAIDNAPTAFDVDGVVKELEARRYNFSNAIEALPGADIRAEAFARATEIVKGAVKNE